MCCFAGHVSDVSATNIFARVNGNQEYLVYEMTFSSDEETAMILPIPTASALEDAVAFVPLDSYPNFFRDLEAHFERVRSEVRLLGGAGPAVALKVRLVGAFEASFVPSLDQFDRLDARFRIPPDVWSQLPAYDSFGFVVFKLRPGRHVSVHPMAFSFLTRDPGVIFFPTMHVHDGTIHKMADFDHILYTQNQPARGTRWPGAFWLPGNEPASQYLDTRRTRGLVEESLPCFQMAVVGSWPNSDIVVPT
jgi:hypothetical protein